MEIKKRNVYLQMKSLEEARNTYFSCFDLAHILQPQQLNTDKAVGRVTAEPVFAKVSSPNYYAAAVDGVAVKSTTTFGTSPDRPKDYRIGIQAHLVNTGQRMPQGTDSVIMIEQVLVINKDTVRLESGAYPWQNVRKVGEDIVATELIIAQNHLITPYDAGALLSGGVFSVSVKEPPKVVIIPTGSELIAPQQISTANFPPPDKTIESNSTTLGALAEQCGGIHIPHPIVADDFEALKKSIYAAAHGGAHIIIVGAGSSAGSEDYTPAVIADLGEVIVHGITMMPGKPTLLGIVNNKPVVGIPGYPVSGIMAFEEIVIPMLYTMLGLTTPKRQRIKATLTRKIASKLGMEEFVRVKLGIVDGTTMASPLSRGAGAITSLTKADGILRIPLEKEGIHVGQVVDVELLRPPWNYDGTIVMVGSHDNTLDILDNELRKISPRLGLSSTHVGSMGGLIALAKGYCHVAGCHLLDPETGIYNIPFLKQYLPKIRVKVVNLVYREQGLIVYKGNPKNLQKVEDLQNPDVRFINRQPGSGTRLLFDYQLSKMNIDRKQIPGYNNEEYTHMSVAAAVLSGAADVGLGIYAAAEALGLDFVPITTEQYDIIIPIQFLEDKKIQRMLEVIKSPSFQSIVSSLGGYDISKTGTEIEYGGNL